MHLDRSQNRRPPTMLVLNSCFILSFIRHLRPDTLAQLMTSSNIQSGSKVILVEHCQGLVVAAALERLAGE